MENKLLCIYHGHCVDGFAAAWVVRHRFGETSVDFFAAQYGTAPPWEAVNRDIMIVDFSYPRDVLMELAAVNKKVLVLDHHKTAQEDLAGLPEPLPMTNWIRLTPGKGEPRLHALFDMERSGAGLTWDYLCSGTPRPALINSVEDRDLWRFKLPFSREVHACLFSHDYDFNDWDSLVKQAETADGKEKMVAEGAALQRQLMRNIENVLEIGTRNMTIANHIVPVCNVPYFMASEAGNILSKGRAFSATYIDTSTHRAFSLRSQQDGGIDVSEIAKQYGGGGHKNAAGFTMPLGWEGDK
jgi:oligoribonuclease NrnB/cAMP/cGMP phosphodiesterase (DHH superfamily)